MSSATATHRDASVFIVAQNDTRNREYLISWFRKKVLNSHYSSKVLFTSLYFLRTFTFLERATINFIFWDFLMFYQILLSPQMKRCAIITYKHGIYELPHDSRLRYLGNMRKVSKTHRMIAQRPVPRQNENFANTSKKLWKTEIKLFPQCTISKIITLWPTLACPLALQRPQPRDSITTVCLRN